MKAITLTRGLQAFVDDGDYDLVGNLKWYASKVNGGKTYYAARHTSRKSEKHTVIYMHRVILGLPPEVEIDHRDCNGLNNQRENLRVCAHGQNMMNLRKRVNVTSRYKGVFWSARNRRWIAQIQVRGKKIYLGTSVHEEAAAEMYNAAASKYFGEFAKLNLLEGR